MNGRTQSAYAPEFKQRIVELYAGGRGPSALAKEFGCSDASVRASVKQAGALRSLPDAGSAVRRVQRQAHQVQAALAQPSDALHRESTGALPLLLVLPFAFPHSVALMQ